MTTETNPTNTNTTTTTTSTAAIATDDDWSEKQSSHHRSASSSPPRTAHHHSQPNCRDHAYLHSERQPHPHPHHYPPPHVTYGPQQPPHSPHSPYYVPQHHHVRVIARPPPLILAGSPTSPHYSNGHTPVFWHDARTPTASHSSCDSVYDQKRNGTGAWVDLEKNALRSPMPVAEHDPRRHPHYPSSLPPPTSVPISPLSRTSASPSALLMAREQRTIVYHDDDEDEDDEEADQRDEALKNRAFSLLFFLSGPVVCVSFVFAFAALVLGFLSVLACPLHACGMISRQSGPASGLGWLLRRQLKFIAASTLPESFSSPRLIGILILSPFVSMAVAIAAWTAAIFWIFAAIIGDPNGNDRINDGTASVLWVRRWWERWLLKSVA